MAKFQSLAEAVSENLKDGDSAAFEGFTHLIPTAAVHEAIRQGRKDLTLIRMTPDLIYDQMIGMGMARKVIFSYAGNPGVGLLRRLRDAVENSWPQPLEIEEHSHAAMANAYEAGAAGLPCAIFRGYRGAELARVTPNVKSIECPFTGERLAAVPALRPDVSFIHAQKADRKGNVLVEGIVGIQKEAILAARRAVASKIYYGAGLACSRQKVGTLDMKLLSLAERFAHGSDSGADVDTESHWLRLVERTRV